MHRPRITVNIAGLRDARAAAGYTQARLAHAVGVTPGMIGLIETGRRQPGADLLDRITVELDVDPAAIADIEEAVA